MQDIPLTGQAIIVGLAFFLIGTWMIGRYGTSRLRRKIAQDVANRFQSTTSKVSVRLLGNTGAKFAYHQKSDSPLPKLESTILLLDRSNILHLAYCKARHRSDQLQIRANLTKRPALNLELVIRREQQNLETSMKSHPDSISELTIEDLRDRFYIVTSDTEVGERLFNSSRFRESFDGVAPYLTRLSIARKEPHVFVSVVLVPEAMPPMEQFVMALAKALRKKNR